MKSHTGGVMSFGTGAFICKSGKQKLNTKSSTEAEVVGASNYLPNTLWVQMFLAAQGYPINSSILEQDNESAMKLETNGRMSASQKSRHINIRYFWIKDRTEANQITIRHCPTLEMLADFLPSRCKDTCSDDSETSFWGTVTSTPCAGISRHCPRSVLEKDDHMPAKTLYSMQTRQ